VAPESVQLAGAGRAILLQLANPAVGHGVARHSNFVADPLRRLNGTLRYIYALTNGTSAQREKAAAAVMRAHRPVRAKAAADGTHPAYDAADPALQLWVAATLYDSAMQVYEAVFPPLAPAVAEGLYREYEVLGTALGMPAGLWPATRADFARYWGAQVAGLKVDDTVRAVGAELLAGRNLPAGIKVFMPLARFLTAGLLPPSVRAQYGLAWSPRRERLLGLVFTALAVLVRVTPARIRHAPMRHYLKQLG